MGTLLSLLAATMAAYAVHLGFVARARADAAERNAADAADMADLAIRAHDGVPRDGRHLRRVTSGDTNTPGPWTPPNG